MRSPTRLPVALLAASLLTAAALATTVPATPASAATDYLIITSDALAADFGALATYQAQRGHETALLTIEAIEADNVPGRDLAEQIRNAIRNVQQQGSLRYVVLGGDVGIVPARIVHSNFYPGGTGTDIATDLYFAALDGDWDADGDGIFAEPGVDAADLVPEVAVGRVPVTTPTEVAQYVAKVRAYENPLDDGYRRSALFLGEVLFPSAWQPGDPISLDGGALAEELNTIVEAAPLPLTGRKLYENYTAFAGAMALTQPQALLELGSGQDGLVVFEAHGNSLAISTGDALIQAADVLALNNGPNYFVAITASSMAGAFEQDCILENFLRSPNGGAVAAVGSDVTTFPSITQSYLRSLHEQMLASPPLSLGQALNSVRADLATASEQESGERWTLLSINLLGDPEVAVGPVTAVTGTVPSAPAGLVLRGVVPNPFNPSTTLRFDLLGAEGASRPVRVTVHEANGRRVRMLWQGALGTGPHELVWDGRDDRGRPMGSGMYLAVVKAGPERVSAKMVLLK